MTRAPPKTAITSYVENRRADNNFGTRPETAMVVRCVAGPGKFVVVSPRNFGMYGTRATADTVRRVTRPTGGYRPDGDVIPIILFFV